MVQRSRFDNYLTEQAVHAGATLMDETTVKSVEIGEGAARTTVRTTRVTLRRISLLGPMELRAGWRGGQG